MRESEWKAWLESLPSTSRQIKEVKKDLERQRTVLEKQLMALVSQVDKKQEQRTLMIKINAQ